MLSLEIFRQNCKAVLATVNINCLTYSHQDRIRTGVPFVLGTTMPALISAFRNLLYIMNHDQS